MNPRNRNILIAAIVVIVVVVAGVIGVTSHKKSAASSKTVNIGIMTSTKQDDAIWKVVSETAKDKYGITLKFTHFTDYTQPNKALENGSIDLDAFQHYAFLNAWNKANKTDLISIGDTMISPIHIYSSKYKTVSDIPNGGTIAVPNDASNESRALYVLKSAGLIKLNVSGDTLATTKNITENPKHLVIKELDAAQTARALDSVAASVVNFNYATAAKLPEDESIYAEPINKDSAQWINLIAAKKSEKNNKIYKEVVKAYETTATKKAIKEQYPTGGELPAWGLKLK